MANGKVKLGGQAQRKSKVNLATTIGIVGGGKGDRADKGGFTRSVRGKQTNVAAGVRKVLG